MKKFPSIFVKIGLLSLVAFFAWWVFMIFHSSNKDAESRIKRNIDKAFFQFVEDHLDESTPVSEQSIKPIHSLVDISGFEYGSHDKFEIDDYFITRTGNSEILVFRTKDHPESMEDLNRLLSLPEYDPTNGSGTDRINYKKVSLVDENQKED